jgi:hypothetical protein
MNRNAATNASLPEQEQGADMRRNFAILILASVVLLSTGVAMADTAISYQGRLDAGGQAFNGSVDLGFELFDAASGGSAMGAPVTINGVAVQQGLFQVELDFGAQAWELGRWLQITVDGQLLTPRQKVTAAPLAARAESVIEEAIGSQELEDGGVQAQDIANDSIHSNHIVDGTVNGDDLAAGAVQAAQLADGAVETRHLAPTSIDSTKIVAGAVQPEHIDGGVMNSITRGNIYMVATINSVSSASGSAIVTCNDVNDVPIAGECFADTTTAVTLKRFSPINWDDPGQSAGYLCTYRNDSAGSVTFEARIHCLDVTP